MEGGVCRRRLGAAGFGLSVGLSVWLTDPQRGLASGRRRRDRRSKVQAQLHAGPRLHAGDRGHTGPGKGTLPQSPWGEAGPCVGPGGAKVATGSGRAHLGPLPGRRQRRRAPRRWERSRAVRARPLPPACARLAAGGRLLVHAFCAKRKARFTFSG